MNNRRNFFIRVGKINSTIEIDFTSSDIFGDIQRKLATLTKLDDREWKILLAGVPLAENNNEEAARQLKNYPEGQLHAVPKLSKSITKPSSDNQQTIHLTPQSFQYSSENASENAHTNKFNDQRAPLEFKNGYKQ